MQWPWLQNDVVGLDLTAILWRGPTSKFRRRSFLPFDQPQSQVGAEGVGLSQNLDQGFVRQDLPVPSGQEGSPLAMRLSSNLCLVISCVHAGFVSPDIAASDGVSFWKQRYVLLFSCMYARTNNVTLHLHATTLSWYSYVVEERIH